MLGYIKVTSVKHAEAPADATSVKIYRKRTVDASPLLLYTFDVDSVDDLSFSFADKNVLSGQTYQYSIVPVVGLAEQLPVTISVVCSFDSIIISDTSGDYIATLNISYKSRKNTPVAYVHPLSSQYPHAVRNGNANYFTGTVEGVFIPYTVSCSPNTAGAKTYRDAALEMLTNGITKTLRTYDGYGWLISVDGDQAINADTFIGSETISFSWTEIGAFPTTGVVIL
jgi:hypothetical protein